MTSMPRRTFLRRVGAGALGAGVLGNPIATAASQAEVPLYIGTYTRGRSRGIYRARLDLVSGGLTVDGVVEGVENPSFLAMHPSGRHLYAVSELAEFEGKPGGGVMAFEVDPGSRDLRLLNRQPTLGGAPCHLNVDASGRFVLVANYSGGNVAVLPILEDGSLGAATDLVQHEGSGPNPKRQEGPHAHSVSLDPANRFAFVADLGIDRVMVYRFDAQRGKLFPSAPPYVEVAAGAGPRHFVFHPDGRRAYVINELDSTLTAFAYGSESGSLERTQTVSTLPADHDGENFCADVHVAASGRFVYGSNRGHDSIAVFAVIADTGQLIPIQHQSTLGRTPRNFAIAPSGRFLLAANQNSDSVTVFAIDATSGKLTPVGAPVDVPVPVCVRFG